MSEGFREGAKAAIKALLFGLALVGWFWFGIGALVWCSSTTIWGTNDPRMTDQLNASWDETVPFEGYGEEGDGRYIVRVFWTNKEAQEAEDDQ